LLESKISKVKIVADDQLKRVSLAFGKDKEEIKIRSDMQRKFHSKLKNISIFEDMSLSRLKRNYVEQMQKKQDIYERLSGIEKLNTSILEYHDNERQKKCKNYKTGQMFQRLVDLC